MLRFFRLRSYRMALPQAARVRAGSVMSPSVFCVRRFRWHDSVGGLIHQTQDGCRCVVADDRSQRDAAGHEIGGGDGGNVVGAMNRPTSPLRGSAPYLLRAVLQAFVAGNTPLRRQEPRAVLIPLKSGLV